ncbi:MFS transporter [Nitrospirillum viridazoti]|uniref:MFS transporter n=2 Tax=Nitrospirillum TaxID=1543705 RepID=A0A248JUY4_9PROT|nr:MFS transporter [Nitrospirillum amazonense]ASG22527.1 MFS transporter [Nitrospirillum amazonense CBAmc]TWB42914.1 putative MFS family arabinose efflux permease [Nitrospirillum amazonense]TWB46887.1 putative MFS family arabinose efflux permease [Nitrospirillum amazonense]
MSNAAGGTPSSARILVASLVGTAVEFYDFYIYATAASLVFGPLFFPVASPSAQLMAAYGSFGIAFLARPLGSIVFGHFGDRIGRKSTLVASLLLMGGSTVLIGLLPTYDSIGWLAPFLLCVLRFGQGFGLGGEWGGAVLLAVENAPPSHRARYGMFPQIGAPVGFIAANGLFLLLGEFLTPAQFHDWGWRLPFLGSAVLVLLGLWVRLKLTETPAFAKALEEGPPPAVPLAEVARDFPRQTLGGTFAAIACFALFYLATAFALGYGTTTLGYSRTAFLGVQLGAILFLAVGIIAAGWWADLASPRRVLMVGCVMTALVGLALAPMMASGSLTVVGLFLCLALLVMGFVYGPLGAWLPSLFPARVRYTGTSMTFNLGGILGGGIAPVLAQSLAQSGGLPYVGAYLAGAALISLAALYPLRGRTAGVAVETPGP